MTALLVGLATPADGDDLDATIAALERRTEPRAATEMSATGGGAVGAAAGAASDRRQRSR
jgi:hypothetical protein